MKICFSGDVFIGGDLANYVGSNAIQSSEYFGADKRIVNIEQAISDSEYSEEKSTLHSTTKILPLLKSFKVDIASLSNNHIQDKGEDGIHDTLSHLKNIGVTTFGAGKDLKKAEKPFKLDENLFLFGYCEHSKSYLNKIKIADQASPGVNPFSYQKVLDDLETIPGEAKAILHLHWGREHVALPDREHIDVSRKLLNHPKVLLIIGMHPHRIQGFISHKNKKAYLSLGNFLFPNFYIKPRTQIAYPEDESRERVKVTKDYHFVGELTYKMWRFINRLSIIIIYDTDDKSLKEVPVFQKKNSPEVHEVKGGLRVFVLLYIQLLSKIYKLPAFIYNPIQKLYKVYKKGTRYSYVAIFLTRQNGYKWTYKRAINYIKR